MEINEKKYWVGFSTFAGIGPKRFSLLRNYFGSARSAWQATFKDLLKVGLEEKLVTDFVEFREKTNLNSSFLRLRENKIECQTLVDKNYPENLKKIDNPPYVLFVKGRIKPQDELALAVVGTRKMTAYGREVTESLTQQLVNSGLTIVSGLARGVDTTAHQIVLQNGGRTIAVLACGLDMIYPPENKKLAEEITNRHGALVSEFPPGHQAVPGNFPARNRIISGLSLGTLVIEGAQDSGSLITARHAADQGREVFAVPGSITSQNSAGPLLLIKQGAKLVYRVNDILEELNVRTNIKNKACLSAGREIKPENPYEERILIVIKDEAKQIDEIVRETGMNVGEVMSLMTMMEIKGMVKNLGKMVYGINK